MAAKKKQDSHPPAPPIRHAPLGVLKVYEVQEHELEQLAVGSPGSLFLNFALFLLPIGLTLIITLATTTIASDRLFLSFVAIASSTMIIGTVLFACWLKSYRSSLHLITQIKNRMPPPEPIVQAVTDVLVFEENFTVKKISGDSPPPTKSPQSEEPPAGSQ